MSHLYIRRALPIPTSLITPGTLFIQATGVNTLVTTNVSRLAMDDPRISDYFQFSRPAAGPNSTNDLSMRFLGARTILSRLLVAAAAKGEILPISPPFLNSSYQVQFHGPMVQCKHAN